MEFKITTQVSVDKFLELMNDKSISWELSMDPERRRYVLKFFNRGDIILREAETADLLDLSNADFRILTAGIADIMERGNYAEPKPDAASAGSGIETPEREDTEGRCGDWEDADRDGVL